MGLDDRQARAVEHAGGPMLVLAGPGTGKTRVITHRIAHLIRERGVRPGSIVALTFTVRAAESLRSRLAELVTPTAAEGIFAGTFHSFARQLIRRFPDRLGFDRAPVLMDSAMRKRLLRDVVAARGRIEPAGAAAGEDWIDLLRKAFAQFHHQALSVEQLRAVITLRTDELERGVRTDGAGAEHSLDELALAARRDGLELFGRMVDAFEATEAERRKRGWLGYDELLVEPIRLLRSDARAAAICRDEYRHVVVDEYQDTNPAQAELLALLSPPVSGAELVVVGDDDQSIYEFRGADDLAFDRFAQRWEGCAQVRLERNYRSSPPVIGAANAVMARAFHRFAPDKAIEPGRSEHAKDARVELVELSHFRNDGEVIARLIRQDREWHERQSGEKKSGEARAWKSYAVIVRTHGDGARIASALELAGVPYVGRRPDAVASDGGVRRLLAWVELLSDPVASWAARGVLGAAPVCAPADASLQWERAYAAQRSRSESGGMPGFASWLIARLEDEGDALQGEERAAVERFAALYKDLQSVAREETAERTVIEIVRRAGLADAELLSPRHRAVRVRNLVSAIGFVRGLQPKLPMPGDARTLWAYYQDLDADEQTMGKAIGEEALDSDGPDEQDLEADAVQVLTAHSSKGLEFDTVFVPRVAPPHGYPSSRSRDDAVPTGMLPDAAGDERSDKERMYDEERRLFYVAMTRAERRAVVLTVKTKSASKSVHFAQQLAADMGSSLARLQESDVLALQPERLDHELAEQAANSERAEGERSARRRAAEALARAGSAEDEAAFERAVEQLRESAAALAAHGRGTSGGEVPAWLGGAAAVRTGEARRELVMRPVTGPLRLSYTMVNSYLRCPRCWYMGSVLKLPEEASGASVVGKAVHTALHGFYDELRNAEAMGEPSPTVEGLRERAERVYNAMLPRDQEVDRAARESVVAMAAAAHEKLHEANAEILELEYKLVMDWPAAGDGSKLEVRLDRLDRLGEQHRIVDYKTGRARPALLEPVKNDLQMCLYAHVLADQMEVREGWAEYWVLRTGERGRIGLSDLDVAGALETVATAVDGIRSGRFEAGKGCESCSWIDGEDRGV